MSIFDKIKAEYPELMVGVDYGGSSPPGEVVRAYYELKMMESQKMNNKIMIILTAINVVLVGLIGFLTIFR